MDHHARVLQKRVQVAAIGRRRELPQERVGGEQHEGQKAGGHQTKDTDDACAKDCRQGAPKGIH